MFFLEFHIYIMIGTQNRSVLWLVEKLFEKRMWLVSMVLTHISRKPHNSFLCLLLCLTLVKSSNSWVVITHAILCEETTEKKHSSTLWWLNRVSVSLSNFFFFRFVSWSVPENSGSKQRLAKFYCLWIYWIENRVVPR